MSERIELCSNCFNFAPSPESNKGECRAECAKQLNSCDAYQWPKTLATSWCGQHRPLARPQSYEPTPRDELATTRRQLDLAVQVSDERAQEIERLKARVFELCAENDGLLAARNKLQAFKVWVHQYLDAQDVPHHPPGTHGAEGCRIGDRMDWLMAKLRAAESRVADLQRECEVLRVTVAGVGAETLMPEEQS